MKIYITDNKSEAEQFRQLFRLNSECAGLHWSTTITDVPVQVMDALETIELFVESRVQEKCEFFDELNESEEKKIIGLIREQPALRKNLGTGVVTDGAQAEEVRNLIDSCDGKAKMIKALETGKNVILF